MHACRSSCLHWQVWQPPTRGSNNADERVCQTVPLLQVLHLPAVHSKGGVNS